MRLSVKITLLLALTVSIFIAGTSIFLYKRISASYQRQAKERLQQSVALLDLRMESLRRSLGLEMDQLAAGLFSEQEPVLAAMLSQPPQFNREVVGFAERIKKRTTLSFLTIVSPEGIILSDSRQPALFGKRIAQPAIPENEALVVGIPGLALQYRKSAQFGNRKVFLNGGYFLADEIVRIPYPGTEVTLLTKPPQPAKPFSDTLVQAIPMKDFQGKELAWISVASSVGTLVEEKRNLVVYSTTFIVLFLLVSVLAGHLLSRRITAPLQELTEAANLMGSGIVLMPLEERGGVEVKELIRAFNQMTGELEEKQRLLLQAERVAAWQEIARHLAHEIKNPLTPIKTSIMNLRVCLEKAPSRFNEVFNESSESILEEVEKLRHLADEFSDFARLPPPSRKSGDLNAVVQKCLLLYQANGSASVQFEPGKLPSLEFDPEQISQVVHNLVRNAVEAAGTSGSVLVSTSLGKNEPVDAILAVVDNGPGMDAQVQRQIFTPYFTTKSTGTGLGLAIVQRIITEHQGSIHVKSEPGHGTRFEVHLPASKI
jgi:signal transduction histidine kinase